MQQPSGRLRIGEDLLSFPRSSRKKPVLIPTFRDYAVQLCRLKIGADLRRLRLPKRPLRVKQVKPLPIGLQIGADGLFLTKISESEGFLELRELRSNGAIRRRCIYYNSQTRKR